MKYRFHRGGLDEAMKTVVEVHSLEQLKNHIQKHEWDNKPIELKFKKCQYDDRIGWDTWMVLSKLEDENEYYPDGWTDGDPNTLPETIMTESQILELYNRVQTQLDNNWAVDAKDINQLLRVSLLYLAQLKESKPVSRFFSPEYIRKEL